ncbi:MAG: peptidylprolyl isomerase [Bacteroidales bacterium]|jgi:peptidyl-prolyl cis-trans isomerase B (cyclophilin B)|nr:peptidylprolyl isomerase [Bacteroidales bacterium]
MKRINYIILVISTLLLSSASGYSSQRYFHIRMNTNKGEIILLLYNQTPLHRDNFVKLSKEGYFNGVLFHRVINDFMIQSGDPDSREREPGKLYGDGGPDKGIPAEFVPELFHKRGSLAAAREGDITNPNRESSGSQFYIVEGKIHDEESLISAEKKLNNRNEAIGKKSSYRFPEHIREYYKKHGGTPHLDTQYTVFGEVISGMDVVFMISESKTDSNDRPLEDVYIISTQVYKKRLKK